MSHTHSPNPAGRAQPDSATSANKSSLVIEVTSSAGFNPELQHSWFQRVASFHPLVCGGIAPTIVLFALSGCADRWGINIMDGLPVEEPDPEWVIIITSVAAMVGLIANFILLWRILGRGNPKLMQLLCITLWLLEGTFKSWYNPDPVGVMNFVTIGIYVQIVGESGGWSYAQGFWMTVCSAAMATVCSILMAIHSFFLPGRWMRSKMELSGPQRTFVLEIMLFIFWLAL
jgi:hypothetical protein